MTELMNLSLGNVPIGTEDKSATVMPESTTADLSAIYKKAERFGALSLLSGNTVAGDVADYIATHYGIEGKRRLSLAKYAMQVMNYKPSPDVLLMLSCTNKARVVIATAGAGKTTSLQLEIVVDKMLDKVMGTELYKPEPIEGTPVTMPRILYLNYNKHNVAPIEQRCEAMCHAMNKVLKSSDAIDDSIESSTVHAFCHKWLTAFSNKLGLPELKIISDEDKSQTWSAIITPRWTKFYGDKSACTVEYSTLDELYTYKVESMLDWDEFFLTAKFVDTGLKAEFVQSCIKKYDSMKRALGQMDFTDYLLMMIDALRANPELKLMLQTRYRLIIADENQDFTRLMNELLLELYEPSQNKLIVVGDPDQTIYEFKGVSPDNVVNLTERLQDAQLLGLDTNYRCPDLIVDSAKKILDLNIMRFKKPINTVRTGGKIITHPLDYSDSQSEQVVAQLKRLGPEAWPDTVLTYRNNRSSLEVCEEMYYAGIPFRVLDGRRPFSNIVFRHIDNAIRALKEKDNFELNKELFRFMPLKHHEWVAILEENRDKRRNHLHDLAIRPAQLPRGTEDALSNLVRISEIIDTNAVADYIGSLIRLYRTYYFDYMIRSVNPSAPEQTFEMRYLERTEKFFNRQLTWEYMQKELIQRNVDNPAGVTVSTFHGLKGLEFDYVLAIDFSESIFPNYSSIEEKYKPVTAIAEKEAENRLCYVLVTRTIKELHLYYPTNDPSIYVNILTKDGAVTSEENSAPSLELGTLTPPSGIHSAQMNFIQRLTKRGG